ncbi:hypothetical protein BD410DRAFT_155406 [Rickenella mellea]|uniref:Uncharacterized protein n=1 Tax=Rickenella mellea TaxID=50990 RepID=A0A4Y7PIJ6_9AGAM|nr:hypothetical protein BD410DRAFT_155406 [Rickenella mellea]
MLHGKAGQGRERRIGSWTNLTTPTRRIQCVSFYVPWSRASVQSWPEGGVSLVVERKSRSAWIPYGSPHIYRDQRALVTTTCHLFDRREHYHIDHGRFGMRSDASIACILQSIPNRRPREDSIQKEYHWRVVE